MNLSGPVKRREAISLMGAGAASLLIPRCSGSPQNPLKGKTHIITLSFDDGFKKSFMKTAELYEKYNLSACLNVLATVGLTQDAYQQGVEIGDFELWNELQSRGHEIMPHGYRHANLSQLPFAEATGLIDKCLDIFSEKLDGFDPKKAVFNFPYNASTPELEAYLDDRVMGYRTGGNPVNPLPVPGQKKVLCTGFGPGNTDNHLRKTLAGLFAKPSGWLVYNTHGLDDEGWGPLSSSCLDELLDEYSRMQSVAIMPAGAVFKASLTMPKPV